MTLSVGDRFEVMDRWPYDDFLEWDENVRLFILVVGCRGTVTKSYRTWDGVDYIHAHMDLEPGAEYAFDPEWCRSLSPLECLAEGAE